MNSLDCFLRNQVWYMCNSCKDLCEISTLEGCCFLHELIPQSPLFKGNIPPVGPLGTVVLQVTLQVNLARHKPFTNLRWDNAPGPWPTSIFTEKEKLCPKLCVHHYVWPTREAHTEHTAEGERSGEQWQNCTWLQHEPVIKYGQSRTPPGHGLNTVISEKYLWLRNATHKRRYNTATMSKNSPLGGLPHRWEKFHLKTHLRYWPTLHFIR